MKIIKNPIIASIVTLIIRIADSSSFCTDPDDYECKRLGITECVPKLNRSPSSKLLPIEKPPCPGACLNTDSWCEERAECISKDEVCDCGPDKIYCTSSEAYSCESRKGILQSNIFNICPNGDCKKNCSMEKEDERKGCREGQFRCGASCVDKGDVVRFRSCNKQCISVHKTCFDKQHKSVINDSKTGLSSGGIYIICAVSILCGGVYSVIFRNSLIEILRQFQNWFNK